MSGGRVVSVFGAYGHTGRFIVAELCRRGWTPIRFGRDANRLATLGNGFPALEQRIASVDSLASLDRALEGTIGVINCAGPFLDTATPVVQAALRARIHYLDLCAEQQAVFDVYERFAGAAKAAGVTVMPAMAFYGGLADLLATAALGDWPEADSIEIAVALDSWHPTAGTRLTGARNRHRRLVVSRGELQALADPPPSGQWKFQAPFGIQDMVELPLSEIITLARHVRSAEVHSSMNLAPLQDLRDPDTPPPSPIDPSGRSAQIFMLDVVVRRGEEARRATAHGRDIYAITAPLVVEALQRISDGRCKTTGVAAPGEAFDARDFLESVPGVHVAFPRA
jgi:uncharacterized protein YbjT (DUF2867 family)